VETTPLVWYVAYGSNLDTARLRCYLEGGVAPGRTEPNPGARDRTAPRASRATTLPHPVRFVGRAPAWGGGGYAVLEHGTVDPPPTLGRAWLLTVAQLADVLDQECGRPSGTTGTIDVGAVAAAGAHVLGEGAYDRLVGLGPIDDVAALTFTSPVDPADRPAARPSPAYLATMAAGLRAAHGLDDAAIARYLASVPGTATDA